MAVVLLKCSFVDVLLYQSRPGSAIGRVRGVDHKEGADHKSKGKRRTKELVGKTCRGKIE